eukprot:TRINITY_DN9692_c0_g1_i1.p1 TRINITY_DN9692_c0_g1~~TRINITY_DN9692_c0_g1_i1.p1  ORF type:complete len:508 (-),score=92.78 TRINITY_DN9692_c0_g1_i1:6-1373(-)
MHDSHAGPADALIAHTLGRLVRWDAIYFVGIAQKGYEYEQEHAFFPLLPCLMQGLSRVITMVTGGMISDLSAVVIAGVLLSNIACIIAAVELYKLVYQLIDNETLAYNSALLFSMSPASIFLSAPYTESIFSLFVFSGLRQLHLSHGWLACVLFSLATAVRSNGILLCGFVVFYGIHVTPSHAAANTKKTLPPRHTHAHGQIWYEAFDLVLRVTDAARAQGFIAGVAQAGSSLAGCVRLLGRVRVVSVVVTSLQCFVVVLPFVAFQYYAFTLYCHGVSPLSALFGGLFSRVGLTPLMAPAMGVASRPWCSGGMMPNLYSFVQKEYWNQGFFQYYELKQVPNFLLAAPMVYISARGVVEYLRGYIHGPEAPRRTEGEAYVAAWRHPNLLPHVLYWAALLLFSVTFMHVQVITRFFTHIPVVHIFEATLLAHKRPRWWVLFYHCTYILVGSLLYTTF